jgi:hypothetical protein
MEKQSHSMFLYCGIVKDNINLVWQQIQTVPDISRSL